MEYKNMTWEENNKGANQIKSHSAPSSQQQNDAGRTMSANTGLDIA
jgi:hypothetical protein